MEFSKDEVERWLAQYINKKYDIKDTFHESSIDLREMDNEIIEIKTKHKITVALMRDYIEEWLTQTLVKITETNQHEVVTMVIPPLAQQKPSTKNASSSK